MELSASDIERFWSLVDKQGPTKPHMSTPCWLWTGTKTWQGYGQWYLRSEDRNVKAHRVGYQLHHGQPLGASIGTHSCDEASCVRGDHIQAGTLKSNAKEMIERGRAHVQKLNASRQKLDSRGVARIHKLHAQGKTAKEIALLVGVSRPHVSNILNKKRCVTKMSHGKSSNT